MRTGRAASQIKVCIIVLVSGARCVQRRAYKLKEWEGAVDFLEQVARSAGAPPTLLSPHYHACILLFRSTSVLSVEITCSTLPLYPPLGPCATYTVPYNSVCGRQARQEVAMTCVMKLCSCSCGRSCRIWPFFPARCCIVVLLGMLLYLTSACFHVFRQADTWRGTRH